MKHTVQALVIMSCVFLSVGCATDRPQSDAMTVAKAAGFSDGLRDAPADTVHQDGSLTHELTAASDIGNIALSSAAPTVGLTSLAGGGVAVLALLEAPAQASRGTGILIWRPQEPHSSDHEIMLRYGRTISQSIYDALLHQAPELKPSAPEFREQQGVLQVDNSWRIRFHDDTCQQPNVQCDIFVGASRDTGHANSLPTRLAGFEGPQVVMGFSLTLPLLDRRPLIWKQVAHGAVVDALVEASAKLPTVWIYCPAFCAGYRRKDGTIAILPAPVIIHEGGILTFTLPSAPAGTQP